jgi:hypothetical protein
MQCGQRAKHPKSQNHKNEESQIVDRRSSFIIIIIKQYQSAFLLVVNTMDHNDKLDDAMQKQDDIERLREENEKLKKEKAAEEAKKRSVRKYKTDHQRKARAKQRSATLNPPDQGDPNLKLLAGTLGEFGNDFGKSMGEFGKEVSTSIGKTMGEFGKEISTQLGSAIGKVLDAKSPPASTHRHHHEQNTNGREYSSDAVPIEVVLPDIEMEVPPGGVQATPTNKSNSNTSSINNSSNSNINRNNNTINGSSCSISGSSNNHSLSDTMTDDSLIDHDQKVPADAAYGKKPTSNSSSNISNSKTGVKSIDRNSSNKASFISNDHHHHLDSDSNTGVAFDSYQEKMEGTHNRKRSVVAEHDGGFNATGTKKKSRPVPSMADRSGTPKKLGSMIHSATSAPPKLTSHRPRSDLLTPRKTQRSSVGMPRSVGPPLNVNAVASQSASPATVQVKGRLLPSVHIPRNKVAKWHRCFEHNENLDETTKNAGLEAVEEVIRLGRLESDHQEKLQTLQKKYDQLLAGFHLMEEDRDRQHALLKKTGSFLDETRVELVTVRRERDAARGERDAALQQLETTRDELDSTQVELDAALGALHR